MTPVLSSVCWGSTPQDLQKVLPEVAISMVFAQCQDGVLEDHPTHELHKVVPEATIFHGAGCSWLLSVLYI